VGAGLPANEFCQAEIRGFERLRAPCPVLRLTPIRPGCPRIAKSHGLFAHSVRVFHAAERGRGPGALGSASE